MQRRHSTSIDTVPVKHDLSPYVPLLDVDGTLAIVGQLGPVAELNTFPLVAGRRRIAGSPSGGLLQTQELLDFWVVVSDRAPDDGRFRRFIDDRLAGPLEA